MFQETRVSTTTPPASFLLRGIIFSDVDIKLESFYKLCLCGKNIAIQAVCLHLSLEHSLVQKALDLVFGELWMSCLQSVREVCPPIWLCSVAPLLRCRAPLLRCRAPLLHCSVAALRCSVAPLPRSVAPLPRSVAPLLRCSVAALCCSVAPLPRSVAPLLRCSVAALRCSVAPLPRSVAPLLRCSVAALRCSVAALRCSVAALRCSVAGLLWYIFKKCPNL